MNTGHCAWNVRTGQVTVIKYRISVSHVPNKPSVADTVGFGCQIANMRTVVTTESAGIRGSLAFGRRINLSVDGSGLG
jgi:hypothetical protein